MVVVQVGTLSWPQGSLPGGARVPVSRAADGDSCSGASSAVEQAAPVGWKVAPRHSSRWSRAGVHSLTGSPHASRSLRPAVALEVALAVAPAAPMLAGSSTWEGTQGERVAQGIVIAFCTHVWCS